MFHEIMIDLREYRLRRRRLKWSRLYWLLHLLLSVRSVADTNDHHAPIFMSFYLLGKVFAVQIWEPLHPSRHILSLVELLFPTLLFCEMCPTKVICLILTLFNSSRPSPARSKTFSFEVHGSKKFF